MFINDDLHVIAKIVNENGDTTFIFNKSESTFNYFMTLSVINDVIDSFGNVTTRKMLDCINKYEERLLNPH